MAAAAVECPIEGTISSSSVPPGASHDELESPTPSKMASKQTAEELDKSSPEKQSAKNADNSAASSSAEESGTERSPQKSTQDPPAGSQPGSTSPQKTSTQSGAGAGSDSDDEPVSRSRPRARRLALDSDEEAEDADRPPTPQDGGGEDSDGADAAAASPAPVRARVRRPAVDSDSDNDEANEGKTEKAAKPTGKGNEPAAKARIESEDEDSEDAERKRKEKNMKKLMALGDSSSEDERPAEERRPQTPTTGQDEEDQSENVKSGSKKKPQKKKGERRKVEQAAAEQMREIRSAAQRRTRESRLNLPYHRPRQRTLHEFLARRQKAPALPDHPRITGAEADYITRRLEEKEKEIEEFYKSESDHEKDGPGSDPEWKPEGAPTPAAAAGPSATATTTTTTPAATATNATTTAAAQAPQETTKEEEEEDKVMSQSSQKVQEWLEGVQPGSDGTGTPPMMDTGEETHVQREKAGTKAETEAGIEMETETETGVVEATKKTDVNTVDMADQAEPEISSEAAAKTLDPKPTAAAALTLEKQPIELDESRSVSADTETTSLAPGDSASEVNARIATSAAAAAATITTTTSPAVAATAAPPAARLARLAARLPQLGAVLGATPRLQKQSEVITLDDSDEESKQEPSDLDKFVERFVRHSKAKPKKQAEKKTVNISLVRYETDSAGGQQLVADSVPVTVNTSETADADDGPPGAQRQQLQRVLKDSIRRKREEARQRREREYKLYNSEQVDDGYLDDLPDEEAEPSDVSSESGESEPEEEPPLTETPRKRCPLVDDEAEQEEDEEGDGDGEEDGEKKDEEDGEMRLVLEDDDDEDLLDSPPRRASVITEPELFSTQPGAGHGDAASQADSQDSLDRASSSLVTAHQPGGGFQFGGSRQRAADEPQTGADAIPMTPALNTQTGGEALPETQPTEAETQPVDTELETQPIDGTGSFSLALESEDIPLPPAVASADSDLPDSLSQLGPLRLTPEHRTAAGRGARSAIAALLDPAADESMDDLMSLCSGKFDAPGTGKMAKVTRADTQPVDLLSVPAPNNKDGVWTAGANTQKRTQNNSSEPMSGMSMMSTVDIFEDGNANMPLDIVSDDEGTVNSQLVRSKKRRRRLVFSDDENSGGADEPFEHASASEDEDNEDSGEDSVQTARQEDSLLPTDFTGFLGGGDKKKMREFFEAEAELSGSDEPSEDEEDGEDLDRMEEEEADAEQIDEERLREQVERIHQKKALDEDIRDLKLFQERFLEDGDLHGKGRERKFRWSNADDGEDDTGERRPSDDEADAGEEERDEQWRLERHEREKWLQEHAQKQGQDEDEGDSGGFTFLKPGQKVVRRLVSTVMRSASTETAAAAPAAPAPAAPARAAGMPPALPASPRAVKLVSRGSFLRRGKEALARLVTTARSLSMPAGTSSKNSTNRTFSVGKRQQQQQQSESEPIPEIEAQFQQTVAEKTTKRKTPSTPAVDAKRAKLSRSFSSLAEDSQSNSLFSVIL